MKNIMIALNGFLMAFADSVPGVSGGTIAFLMGIYDEFISSINGIISRDGETRKKSLLFLVKLGIGWVIGFALAVTILSSLFTEKIYLISSVFLGFILFSVPVVAREEKEALTGNFLNALFIIPGAALVLAVTFIRPASEAADLSSPDLFGYIYLFLSGAAAVSAMVLPGISGSTIMLILGVYLPIINAVKDLLHLELSSLKIIIPMGLGIIAGALLIIKLIKGALDKHRGALMYFVLGMMGASTAAIVKGPETLDVPQPAMDIHSFNILCFILGGAVILLLCFLRIRFEKKNIEKNREQDNYSNRH